jgi:hypothetical protein
VRAFYDSVLFPDGLAEIDFAWVGERTGSCANARTNRGPGYRRTHCGADNCASTCADEAASRGAVFLRGTTCGKGEQAGNDEKLDRFHKKSPKIKMKSRILLPETK